jgi:methylmalonyl-CoA mutase C-terminal domain/subunit
LTRQNRCTLWREGGPMIEGTAPACVGRTLMTMTDKKIRVLLAKPGLDGHDRGVKVVARALRDAGMEVIYMGLRQTPEMVVEAAIQEDVNVVGLSILSGAHMTLVPRVVEGLKANGLDDVIVTLGGIIPDDDIPQLTAIGVKGIFGPGTSTQEIIGFIRQAVAEREPPHA